VVLVPGLAGALIALALGLLTFGVQATAQPHSLPLAIGATDASAVAAVSPITQHVTTQGGDAVAWRVVASRMEAEHLLDRKEIYGALLLSPEPKGLTATVLVSGAVTPAAAQVAQPLLTQVARAVTAAGASPAVEIASIHPTSAAGRTLPLAASALLWFATLVTSVLVVVAVPRLQSGWPAGPGLRISAGLSGAVLGTAVVLGLATLWDSGLPLGWEVIAFLGLVGIAFALLQGGILRWLGLPGIAVLAPLYLMAPSVAGLPPELINPAYRALLWSWTPFRFSSEGLRSLLFIGSTAPDVAPALWGLAGIGLAGLLLMLAPKPSLARARVNRGVE